MADYAEFKEGWRVVFASLVGIGLGLSPVPFYTIGMFAPELAREFHWQYAQILFGLTVTTFTVLISAPAAGFLADRIGVRPVVLGSIVLFGLSFAAFSMTIRSELCSDSAPATFDSPPRFQKGSFAGFDPNAPIEKFGRHGLGLQSDVARIASQARAVDAVLLSLTSFTTHCTFGGVGLNAERP